MGVAHHRLPARRGRGIAILPTTRLGWWAVWLAATNPVLMVTWTVVPGGGFLGLASGFAGGSVGLVAISRRGERAITVFAALLPFVLVLLFLAAELIVGHD